MICCINQRLRSKVAPLALGLFVSHLQHCCKELQKFAEIETHSSCAVVRKIAGLPPHEFLFLSERSGSF